MTLADRAYALLKYGAVNTNVTEAEDWIAGARADADADTAFETDDAVTLDPVKVAALHIRRLSNLFLAGYGPIAAQLENESWVFGKFAEKPG